jgi:hypothetical protein
MRALASACTMLACSTLAAGAQDLPRLHITALGLHADRPTVAAGDTYHITVHVHIAERRDRLDELQLPTFTNATDLGDERRRVATPGGGTDFYEIMTVSSPDPGTASFSPAYIDAIDPATGHGLRYSSRPLSVRVVAAVPSAAPTPAIERVTDGAKRLVRDLLIFGGIGVAVVVLLIVVVLRRSRRARPAPPPRPRPRVTVVHDVPSPAAALRDAVAAFRVHEDDATLDALRNVLFVRAGASPGATLADALAALGARDPDLAHAMAIAERVRFGPRSERGAATRDLFNALAVVASGVRA